MATRHSRRSSAKLILLSVLVLSSAFSLPVARTQTAIATVIVDATSNTVSATPNATYSVFAIVNVGKGPVGLTYDSAKGEVFVNDFFQDAVSVISDADNTVVANVTVGNSPVGIAYDSTKGENLRDQLRS